MSQHDSLSAERWAAFSMDQQVLMIANEMHRAMKLDRPDDGVRRRNALERVLRLTDLTIGARREYGFRRELLRFRDLAAAGYLESETGPVELGGLTRALLLLTWEAARQRGPLGLL